VVSLKAETASLFALKAEKKVLAQHPTASPTAAPNPSAVTYFTSTGKEPARKLCLQQGMVVHACNPSYSGGVGRGITVLANPG
jgi:hypothetical protein